VGLNLKTESIVYHLLKQISAICGYFQIFVVVTLPDNGNFQTTSYDPLSAYSDITQPHTLRDSFRPGHADLSYFMKYGIRDHRGGGRSFGRETIGRVAAGAVAMKWLQA